MSYVRFASLEERRAYFSAPEADDARKKIVVMVAEEWRVKADKIRYPLCRRGMEGRDLRSCEARGVAMLLTRDLLGQSYPQIGDWFRRDHTTVLYHVDQIRRKMKKDEGLRRKVEELAGQLEGSTPPRA